MTAIVRVAIVAVTLALFFAAMMNALLGHRDIAVLLALATPLGLSAWAFAGAGHNEAAMGLLCCVMIVVVTLILVINPLGVHDMAVTAYGGIVLVGALLLSRRAFLAIVGLALVSASIAFAIDLNGFSRSLIAYQSGWPQYVDFLVITLVFAVLGRVAAEQLIGSLGNAHEASLADTVTGLVNRSGFLGAAANRLSAAHETGVGATLVISDLDAFRRVNLVIGHAAADNILREAARRLLLLPGDPLVARVGDDEFAVLATGVSSEAAPAFAREVHAALDFEFLGVSVRNAAGYSRFPRDANGIESLLLGAESGVSQAKSSTGERLAGPADRI